MSHFGTIMWVCVTRKCIGTDLLVRKKDESQITVHVLSHQITSKKLNLFNNKQLQCPLAVSFLKKKKLVI